MSINFSELSKEWGAYKPEVVGLALTLRDQHSLAALLNHFLFCTQNGCVCNLMGVPRFTGAGGQQK